MSGLPILTPRRQGPQPAGLASGKLTNPLLNEGMLFFEARRGAAGGETDRETGKQPSHDSDAGPAAQAARRRAVASIIYWPQ